MLFFGRIEFICNWLKVLVFKNVARTFLPLHFTWICKIKVLSLYGHINLQGQPRTNTAGDKQSKAVQTNWKTKCHRIILCLGMRELWPEKCWQIKKHRELEQTIGQQRICPDCSELLRRTKVVVARHTLSSTRGFIWCCVREVISSYNDISFKGRNFLNSTHLFALTESLAVNGLNHLKWPTPKDFCLLVSFSANGGTNSMQGRRSSTQAAPTINTDYKCQSHNWWKTITIFIFSDLKIDSWNGEGCIILNCSDRGDCSWILKFDIFSLLKKGSNGQSFVFVRGGGGGGYTGGLVWCNLCV